MTFRISRASAALKQAMQVVGTSERLLKSQQDGMTGAAKQLVNRRCENRFVLIQAECFAMSDFACSRN